MLTDAQKEAIVDDFDDATFERVVGLVAEENYGLARRIIRANGVEDTEAVEVLLDEAETCVAIDTFQSEHKDYPRTEAAHQRVAQYLADHGLKWTAENLGNAWVSVRLMDAKRDRAKATPSFDSMSNAELSTTMHEVRGLVRQEVSTRRRVSPQGLR